MDARRRLVAAALAALLCGLVTACAHHVSARTGLGPLGGPSPGAGGAGGPGASGGPAGQGVGGAAPTAAPNPGGTTTHGGTGGGTGSGGTGGTGTTTSPSASSAPPSGPPTGKRTIPVFRFPNYSIAIVENPGKICAWRITPGGSDISIGFSVKLGYTGSPSPQPETVTLSSDLTTRTEVITVTPEAGSMVYADLEISGFNYSKTAYTMHMTATIAPTGGDLITSDDSVSATLSVPAFYPPNGSYFTTIPCS